MTARSGAARAAPLILRSNEPTEPDAAKGREAGVEIDFGGTPDSRGTPTDGRMAPEPNKEVEEIRQGVRLSKKPRVSTVRVGPISRTSCKRLNSLPPWPEQGS